VLAEKVKGVSRGIFLQEKKETVKSLHAHEEDSFAITSLVKAVKKSNRIKREAAS
jgi:hypothetical protein